MSKQKGNKLAISKYITALSIKDADQAANFVKKQPSIIPIAKLNDDQLITNLFE
jgi:hypothetical protein